VREIKERADCFRIGNTAEGRRGKTPTYVICFPSGLTSYGSEKCIKNPSRNGWEGLRKKRGLRERPWISLYVYYVSMVFSWVLQSSHGFEQNPYLKRSLFLKIHLKLSIVL
jgi:hypothetical protein